MNFSITGEVQNIGNSDEYVLTMTSKGKSKRVLMHPECSKDDEYILNSIRVLFDSFKYVSLTDEE